MNIYNFSAAEIAIPDSEEYIPVDNPLQIRFAEYTEQVFDAPVDFEKDVPLSTILYYSMKGTEYMKSTGRCRYMTKFVSDMTRFYEQIELNEIASIGRIQRTLLSGERYDFSLTCQIGFFLNMTSEDLTAPQLSEEQIQQEEKSHYIKGRTIPNWEEYDNKMSLTIEQVAADIYSGAANSMGKPEKVTEKFICRILAIKQHQLENMPKCRAVLERYSESYPESWARKLVWAYEWLENNEEDVFYWKHLRKLTGVKKVRFDEIIPYLKKYADEDMVENIIKIVMGS